MHRGEQLVRNPPALRHAIEAGLILQCFKRGEKGVEDDFLRHDADRIFGVAGIGVDIAAPDARPPARLVEQHRQAVDERRLARAIESEHAEYMPARDAAPDAAQRLLAPHIAVYAAR